MVKSQLMVKTTDDDVKINANVGTIDVVERLIGSELVRVPQFLEELLSDINKKLVVEDPQGAKVYSTDTVEFDAFIKWSLEFLQQASQIPDCVDVTVTTSGGTHVPFLGPTVLQPSSTGYYIDSFVTGFWDVSLPIDISTTTDKGTLRVWSESDKAYLVDYIGGDNTPSKALLIQPGGYFKLYGNSIENPTSTRDLPLCSVRIWANGCVGDKVRVVVGNFRDEIYDVSGAWSMIYINIGLTAEGSLEIYADENNSHPILIGFIAVDQCY